MFCGILNPALSSHWVVSKVQLRVETKDIVKYTGQRSVCIQVNGKKGGKGVKASKKRADGIHGGSRWKPRWIFFLSVYLLGL